MPGLRAGRRQEVAIASDGPSLARKKPCCYVVSFSTLKVCKPKRKLGIWDRWWARKPQVSWQAHEQLLPNSISPTSVSEMATRWDSMVGLRQARGEI